MTAPDAPPSPSPAGYPVSLTYDLPDTVARWRPIVHWLLAIPHFIVLYVLALVAGVLTVVAWFTGVILGRVPQTILDVNALFLRYNASVSAYLYFLHGTYPPFSFEAQTADPGVDERVHLDVANAAEGRSRLTIFFRFLLAIPHFIALYVVSIAAFVVLLIGFFAVIVLGRWPAGLRSFVTGYLRWNMRFSAYLYLLTDEYPPFSLS